MLIKKLVKKLFPTLVAVVTVYFFGTTLIENWGKVRDMSLFPDIYSLIGVSFFVAAVIASGFYWGKLLNTLSNDAKISPADSVRVYSASWLLKYIPGQAGSYLNKLAWGVKSGFSKKAITSSFIYENVLLAFASILPTAPILLFVFTTDAVGEYYLFMPLALALPFLIVVNKDVFYKLVNSLFKKMRNQEIGRDLFLTTKQLVSFQFRYLLPRIINGAGFVFVATSFLNVSVEMYIPLAAVYVLAGIVGLLAIFVPSGIGVREAVIVLFTSQYFSIEEAVTLSIVARFYATIADMGVLVVYLHLNRWKVKQI